MCVYSSWLLHHTWRWGLRKPRFVPRLVRLHLWPLIIYLLVKKEQVKKIITSKEENCYRGWGQCNCYSSHWPCPQGIQRVLKNEGWVELLLPDTVSPKVHVYHSKHLCFPKPVFSTVWPAKLYWLITTLLLHWNLQRKFYPSPVITILWWAEKLDTGVGDPITTLTLWLPHPSNPLPDAGNTVVNVKIHETHCRKWNREWVLHEDTAKSHFQSQAQCFLFLSYYLKIFILATFC